MISTLSAHACLSTANHVTDRGGRHCCYKIVLDSLQCLYTMLYVLVCCILCKYFLRRLSSFLIKHTHMLMFNSRTEYERSNYGTYMCVLLFVSISYNQMDIYALSTRMYDRVAFVS